MKKKYQKVLLSAFLITALSSVGFAEGVNVIDETSGAVRETKVDGEVEITKEEIGDNVLVLKQKNLSAGRGKTGFNIAVNPIIVNLLDSLKKNDSDLSKFKKLLSGGGEGGFNKTFI